MNFPLSFNRPSCSTIKSLKLKHLQYGWFGNLTAPIGSVRIALSILGTLPESGKLALLGLSLIVAALFLRKLLVRFEPSLDASAKASGQSK